MTRRHRIEEPELTPLMKAAIYRLHDLMNKNPGHKDVEHLFKVLWRFERHKTGPPGYPEINSQTVDELLRSLQDLIYIDL
jgi:hypothetical protein